MKEDLKKCGVDENLAKDREKWRAQIMGNTSELRARTDKECKTKRERDENRVR